MVMIENDCPWQALMNTAYDRWNEHNDAIIVLRKSGDLTDKEARRIAWGFDGMLDNCESDRERHACLLGKMNQQIENGGVIQWVDNGYAKDSVDHGLFELLREMGPVSEDFGTSLRGFLEDYMDWDTGDVNEEDDRGYHIDMAHTASDRLSTRFYAIQKEWHPEVYKHLGV